MKKSLIAIFGVILLSSCGGEPKIDLNDTEAYPMIQELAKNFGEEKEIYALEIYTQDHLTSELESLSIDFITDGVDYSQDYNLDNEEGKELEELKKRDDNFQSEFFLKKKQGKKKIKDFDFNLIATKYVEAMDSISEEYEGFTLHNWKYEVNNKGEVTADFKLEGTKKGESTTTQGRNIVTNYYEFSFKMNADKTLTYKE